MISRLSFGSRLASSRVRVSSPRIALLVHLNGSSGRADRSLTSTPLRLYINDKICSRDILRRVSIKIRARLQFVVVSSAQPPLEENEDNNENENSGDCCDSADYSSGNSRTDSDFVLNCDRCVLTIVNLKIDN